MFIYYLGLILAKGDPHRHQVCYDKNVEILGSQRVYHSAKSW
jgi:hypothetical protein